MRLSIAIPEAQLLEAPAVLQLIRKAQVWDMEADDQGPVYVGHFEDFPQSVDVVAQLMEESRDPHEIRITVEGRPIANPVLFYHALSCYRESLSAPDSAAYCAQQAARIGDAGGCPDHMCLSHCQFICSRCVAVSRDRDAPPMSVQLLKLARRAEVDWCPNLRVAKAEA